MTDPPEREPEEAVVAAAAPQPPDPTPDPAPWGLRGAALMVLLSMITQIAVAFVIIGAATVIISRLDPSIVDHPDDLQEMALMVSLGPAVLLYSIITLALIHISITSFHRRAFFESLALRRPSAAAFFGFLVLGFLVALFYVSVTAIVPMPEEQPEGPLSRLAQSGLAGHLVWALLAMAAAPAVEEVLFRGYAYLGARRRLGAVRAGLLVSFVFVLLHFGETGSYWPALAGIATLSGILVIVIERTGNLTYCIACHVGYNAALASLSFFGGGGG